MDNRIIELIFDGVIDYVSVKRCIEKKAVAWEEKFACSLMKWYEKKTMCKPSYSPKSDLKTLLVHFLDQHVLHVPAKFCKDLCFDLGGDSARLNCVHKDRQTDRVFANEVRTCVCVENHL